MTGGGRRGASVAEVLVALLVAALVVRAGWSALAAQRRAAEAVTLGAEVLEVGRTARRVLGLELRSGVAGTDWRVHGGDSLTLRAFRGTGLVCEGGGGTARSWLVGYRGIREPNPAKDSALALLAGGGWEVRGVTGAGASALECPISAGADRYRITLDREVTDPVLIRIFERGSYHLAGSAFRYRVGLGGRQPLTPERLAAGSRLEAREARALLFLDYRWVERISRPLPERWTVWSLER